MWSETGKPIKIFIKELSSKIISDFYMRNI